MSDEIGETLARVCRGVGSHQEGDAVLNWVTNLQNQLQVALTGLAAVHEAERRREAQEGNIDWVDAKVRLPAAGTMVLFVLSGNRIPKAGYFDTKETYCDRTDRWDEADDIVAKDWWTEADDDTWWESVHVTHWCVFREVPPVQEIPPCSTSAGSGS